MSKIKNLVVQAKDAEDLNRIREDYEYSGREVDVDAVKLTVTVRALPRKFKRKSENEARVTRQKRQRSYDPSEPNYEEYADREF